MSTNNSKKNTKTAPPKATPALRFGVEIELIVKSKTKTHADFPGLALELQTHLAAARVSSHIGDVLQKDKEKYQDWNITEDITLTSAPQRNVFGVELVSPVFLFKNQDAWNSEIRNVWRALERNFDVQATTECSTHVHISPAAGPWALAQLKNIARTTVILERCIDAVMPGHRRINPYCMSNRYNQGYKEFEMSLICSDINKAKNEKVLARHMCWCSKNTLQGAITGATKDFVHPHFRWNFTSALSNKQTIEFRQPPGSRSALDTILWVLFATSLVRWAVVGAPALDPEQPARLETLYSAVKTGAEKNMVRDVDLLMGIFRGVKQLPEGPSDLKGVSAAEYRKLEAEAVKKGMAFEKYKKLVAYK
ncbi:putative amidoligase enzyme-domain-containing protein [Chaetomium fimeti]|uniref:Amidoligase enzyme-domain-containing protein n=1 Tax=Chaetomium fimeti TaxID=1854472 RepID=A0AAE0HEQ4_9PEZI|nr:putative amidoligase enzyme-domain-containing protein [Chaetomium fimeti]